MDDSTQRFTAAVDAAVRKIMADFPFADKIEIRDTVVAAVEAVHAERTAEIMREMHGDARRS